jgi:hypothetical protein
MIEQQILPEWQAERNVLASYKIVPEEKRTYVGILMEYIAKREEEWKFRAKGARANDRRLIEWSEIKRREAERLDPTSRPWWPELLER